MLYTDPSGHCLGYLGGFDTAACLGFAVGAGANVYEQLSENGGRWECINIGDALISGGAGAVAGVVGYGAFWAFAPTTFLGMVGVGALGGAASGQFGRLAQGLLSGNFWNMQLGQDFLNPLDMVGDAALGGFFGGVGYGAGQLLSNLKSMKGLGEWGVPEEFYPTKAINPYDAASRLLVDGKIPISNLKTMIPHGSPNEFVPSSNIANGYKYNFIDDGIPVEIKWHSPNLKDVSLYPNSPSGKMWTAQITVNKWILGEDGLFYPKPDSYTHIPVTGNPHP